MEVLVGPPPSSVQSPGEKLQPQTLLPKFTHLLLNFPSGSASQNYLHKRVTCTCTCGAFICQRKKKTTRLPFPAQGPRMPASSTLRGPRGSGEEVTPPRPRLSRVYLRRLRPWESVVPLAVAPDNVWIRLSLTLRKAVPVQARRSLSVG